jgi:signal transduction histidine kinase
MSTLSSRRRSLFSWLFLGLLFALCGILGALQYRWIGEVSVAAREHLQGSLQASLLRLSQDFNSEITSACSPLIPVGQVTDSADVERQLESRFRQWQSTARPTGLLRSVALAVPRQQSVDLLFLNLQTGALEPADWPPAWSDARRRIESMLRPRPPREEGPPGPPESGRGFYFADDDFAFEAPIFSAAPRVPGEPPSRRELAWMVFRIDPHFTRDVLLPELVRRHLGTGGESDYQVTVATRATPPVAIYESDPGQGRNISSAADASVFLFDAGFDQFRRGPQGMPSPGARGRGPGPGPAPDSGRWKLSVRHRAGSLEAVVARARRANLTVTGLVLLLLMAAIAAFVRFTRRAQRLAELQMEFVAGVSHELRTPLTVIHTAAYNLQGKLASQPQQVERYGALIQKESGRLKTLVEQILRFAGAEAGQAIAATAPLSVEAVIDATLESSKALLESSGCTVEKRVAADLPMVRGDAVALQHVLANLIGNAAKYGVRDGARWIGVSAAPAGSSALEIRVADHGPGIPHEEQGQIFDPFFRGARARNAQVHGTGLGLAISRKIVEAHGGTISLKSEPMQTTEFIVRLPMAPGEAAPGGAPR